MKDVYEAGGQHEQLGVFSFTEVQGLAEQGYDVIPLVEKLELNESAGAIYERLRGAEPSFLLESAETDERQGRYSYIGIDPDMIIRLEKEGMMVNGEQQDCEDPYDFVNDLVDNHKVAPVKGLPPFSGGAVGLFGYDLARYREPTIGEAKPDKLDLPELALMVPGVTLAFDHYMGEMNIIKNIKVEPDMSEFELGERYASAVDGIADVKDRVASRDSIVEPTPKSYEALEFESNMTKDEYEAVVRKGIEHTEAGDVFQVVPSQRFSSDKSVDRNFANEVIKVLKRENPSRYAFLFEFGDFEVAGCSPETLVNVTNGDLEHMAIAGTRKRGASEEEDVELAHDLQHDLKEIAEHNMLVDLSRNDVNRVSEPDSTEVVMLAEPERYSHVIHLTSKIIGKLSSDKTAMDALASIAPAGTLSGAPKIRAMQIIDEMEPDKRGFYGGAAGYLTHGGDLSTCIVIRSVVVDKEGKAHVQAGAGVVADSFPESEFYETVMKAAAPMKAIEEVCNPTSNKQQLGIEKPEPKYRSSTNDLGQKVLLIDNYDSYTHNLAQYLERAGADVEVMRNDVSFSELNSVNPDFVVVSPGPGRPEESGVSIGAMRYFPEKGIPSLGVCLGHQALVMAFGGEIVRHKPVHGKLSSVTHDGRTSFAMLPNPLEVMRYHSLVADIDTLPHELVLSATLTEDNDNIVMGLRHKDIPAEGVQFHPESHFTGYGQKIIENFLAQTS